MSLLWSEMPVWRHPNLLMVRYNNQGFDILITKGKPLQKVCYLFRARIAYIQTHIDDNGCLKYPLGFHIFPYKQPVLQQHLLFNGGRVSVKIQCERKRMQRCNKLSYINVFIHTPHIINTTNSFSGWPGIYNGEHTIYLSFILVKQISCYIPLTLK